MKSPKETALEEKILRQLAAHAFPEALARILFADEEVQRIQEYANVVSIRRIYRRGVRFGSVETFRRWHCHTQSATDSICRRPAPIGLVSLHFDFPFVRGDKSNRSHLCRMFGKYAIPDT